MAIKGLSKPIMGKYVNTNGVITYTERKTVGHAIEYSVDISTSDDNPLYADNLVVEHDFGTFSGGTLKLKTSELSAEISAWLLGLTTVTVTVGSGQSAVQVTEYQYNDSTTPLVIGVGLIEEHQINDVNKYRSVFICKCKARIPAGAATTRGEKIDWQVPEIEFDVERSEAENHPWKQEAWHDSETAALAYLETKITASV